MYNVLWIHFVPEHCKPTSCYCLLAAVCTLHDCIVVSNIDCWLRLEEKEYHQEQGWEREQKNGCIIFIFCIRQQAVTLWYRSKFQESSCRPSHSVDIELCIRWLRWKERCVVSGNMHSGYQWCILEMFNAFMMSSRCDSVKDESGGRKRLKSFVNILIFREPKL